MIKFYVVTCYSPKYSVSISVLQQIILLTDSVTIDWVPTFHCRDKDGPIRSNVSGQDGEETLQLLIIHESL